MSTVRIVKHTENKLEYKQYSIREPFVIQLLCLPFSKQFRGHTEECGRWFAFCILKDKQRGYIDEVHHVPTNLITKRIYVGMMTCTANVGKGKQIYVDIKYSWYRIIIQKGCTMEHVGV